MSKEKSVQEGVESAWNYWLYDHPISVPDIIEVAVEKSVSKWLDANSENLIEAIAEKIARKTVSTHA